MHKGGREYVYLRLVEAYRNEQGQVRHRLLHTLGREDELKASGQLDQLAASFARRLWAPAGRSARFSSSLTTFAAWASSPSSMRPPRCAGAHFSPTAR